MAFYLIIVLVIGKMSPFKFLKAIREPQLLAFSTASSAAVMPLSMKTADEKLGVSSNISDFVIPVGATHQHGWNGFVSMRYHGLHGAGLWCRTILLNLILITVTVVAASVGTPAIPGGGVIVLASVLQSAGYL